MVDFCGFPEIKRRMMKSSDIQSTNICPGLADIRFRNIFESISFSIIYGNTYLQFNSNESDILYKYSKWMEQRDQQLQSWRILNK